MKRVAAIASFLLITVPISALAQISPAVDGTDTSVTVPLNGNTFTVDGGTRAGSNLFHSFQQFGLNQGQVANFLSNPTIQNILGRVTGGDASIINGQIRVIGSNANLFLMNPAGIVFGANASLNVPGSFTATTANGMGMGNHWFNAVGNNNYASLIGTPNSFAFTELRPGAIVNAGNLTVGQGQSLTLLGGTVVNTGTLTAPGGTINVAAVPGEKLVRLTQEGNLLSLDLPLADRTAIAPHPLLTPQSLPELLTGAGLTNATGVSADANGTVRLTSSNTVIPSETGTTIVSNQLNAAGVTGGKVTILGQKVGLVDTTINASGINGGGTVLIGGDYQGRGTVSNAQQTYVSPDSVIRVDALQTGNGGRAIVWADDSTRFDGRISARGGVQSGDGGFVEVSGKNTLRFQGNVDTSASKGSLGTILLDPRDVNISNSSSSPAGVDAALADGVIALGDFPSDDIFISPIALSNLAGNISLQASRDITILDDLTFQPGTAAQTISFNAGRDIYLSGTLQTQGRSLILKANRETVIRSFSSGVFSDGGNIELGQINSDSTPRSLTLQAGLGNITTSNLGTTRPLNNVFIGGNNIQIGNVRTLGDLTLDARNNIPLAQRQVTVGGNLQLLANNTLTLTDTTGANNRMVLQAVGSIRLEGTQGVTLQAITNSVSKVESGGDLTLVSNGLIVSNARLISGGSFSAQTTAGTPASFRSDLQTLISSTQDVTFGDYTGFALKVESLGSITAGNITTTGVNATLSGTDPDFSVLAAGPSVILRVGVPSLANAPQTLPTVGGTTFVASGQTTVPATITAGNINTSSSAGGAIILSSPGNIQVGSLRTGGDRSSDSSNAVILGFVNLRSNGNITVQTIDTSGRSNGGDITVNAGGTFRAVDAFLTGDSVDGSTNANSVVGRAVLGASLLMSIRANGIDPGGAEVQIRQGGTAFQVGPNFAVDSSGAVIYRGFTTLADGTVVLGERVVPALKANGSIDFTRFVGVNGNVVSRVIAVSEPLNITDPTVSFTAGAITSNQANSGLVVSVRDLPFVTDLSVGRRIGITFEPRIATVVPPVTPPSTPPVVPSATPPSTPPVVPSATPPSTPPVVPSATPPSTPPVVPSATPPSTPPVVPSATPPSTPPVVPSATPPSTPPVVPSATPPSTPPVVPPSTPPVVPSATPPSTPPTDINATQQVTQTQVDSPTKPPICPPANENTIPLRGTKEPVDRGTRSNEPPRFSADLAQNNTSPCTPSKREKPILKIIQSDLSPKQPTIPTQLP